MGFILLAAAGVLFLISLATETGRSVEAPTKAIIPEEERAILLELIDRAKDHRATLQELRDGIELAEKYGRDEIALMFRDEEAMLLELQRVKEGPINKVSPIEGVSDQQWSGFVRWTRQGKLDTITAGYRLGLYLLDMRQLEDLGWAKDVKREQTDEGRTIYRGAWIEPHSLENFLSSGKEQNEALRMILGRHAKWIRDNPHESGYELIGGTQELEGKLPTFSGLLAVSKQAGLQGLARWIAEPQGRKKATTAAYLAANGIF